ncbi:hypothetical protein GCM10020331_096210 [Ectobacillus funiculus]
MCGKKFRLSAKYNGFCTYGKTKTIGLLIPDLANPFFSELARNIEDSAQELGYSLFICSTDYLSEKKNTNIYHS